MNPDDYLYVYEISSGMIPPVMNIEGLLGMWPEGKYTYLFFRRPAMADLHGLIRSYPELAVSATYRLRYRDWQDLPENEPYQVGVFRIVTGPQQPPLAPGEILLRIDPGVVFGSGIHPTTRGCLVALARLFQARAPRQVLDLGTGSGILAIAAAKLGAQRVEAWDLNPGAVATAAANCRRNQVEGQVVLRVADAGDPLPAADLVCVNIHLDFIKKLLQRPEFGHFSSAVLGGFRQERLAEVLALLPKGLYHWQSLLGPDGWVTLSVVKGGAEPGRQP